jgi:PKD repeat protein
LFGAMPRPVLFDGSGSNDAGGTIVSYLWEFGDGASAGTAAPQHTYTVPGRYTAKLTVTDDAGATANSSVTVDVVVPVSADTYVYEFLGNQSTPGVPTESLLVWNHPSNHGARILIDFASLDAVLAALPANFTATLRLYIICDMGAGGFVSSCPGASDVDGPDGHAVVTTDVFQQLAPWTEDGTLAWTGVSQNPGPAVPGVLEGAKYGTFSVDAVDQWVSVDVTALVQAWRAAGSTGHGIVLSQEAYTVVRDDDNYIPVLGLRSRETSVRPDQVPYLEIRRNP